MLREFEFKTEAEAEAFRDGVEYVNDSAIEFCGIHFGGMMWVASFRDEDSRVE